MKITYHLYIKVDGKYKLIGKHDDYGLLMWDVSRLQDRYEELVIRRVKC